MVVAAPVRVQRVGGRRRIADSRTRNKDLRKAYRAGDRLTVRPSGRGGEKRRFNRLGGQRIVERYRATRAAR
jgi:hypothetical protein